MSTDATDAAMFERVRVENLEVGVLYELFYGDGDVDLSVSLTLPYLGRVQGILRFGDGPNGIAFNEYAYVRIYKYEDTL